MFRKSIRWTGWILLLAIWVLVPAASAADEVRPFLQFCGANGTIFGSTTLLHTGSSTILLDCGLFQEEGYPEEEVDRRNRFLPFSPRDIDYIIVSHAHGDHIGRIPYLIRQGFSGKIYCTEATAELAEVMLRLIEWIYSKQKPLFSPAHVERAIANLVPCEYRRTYTLPDGLRLRFLEAGHILGSAMPFLEFRSSGQDYTLLYSGDIGNPANPLLRAQDTIEEVDFLISESTYGNRRHNPPEEDLKEFREVVNQTVNRGGKVIIPTYVLDRTQNVLYTLNQLIREKAFDRKFDIYVDSVYANEITGIYRKHSHLFHADIQKEIQARQAPLAFSELKTFPPRGQIRGPAVIIAPSGMATTGAVRTHLANYLPDPANAVIFVGFQASGTLGKEILDRKSMVRIDKQTVPVRARSYYLSSFSGHADYRQIVDWLKKSTRIGHIFIIHGQPDSSQGLADHIRADTPFPVTVPAFLDKIYLDDLLPPKENPAGAGAIPILPSATDK